MKKTTYKKLRPSFMRASIDLMKLNDADPHQIMRVFGSLPFIVGQQTRVWAGLIDKIDSLEKRISLIERKAR